MPAHAFSSTAGIIIRFVHGLSSGAITGINSAYLSIRTASVGRSAVVALKDTPNMNYDFMIHGSLWPQRSANEGQGAGGGRPRGARSGDRKGHRRLKKLRVNRRRQPLRP